MMKYILTLAMTMTMFFAQAQTDSTGLYLGINTVQLIRLAGESTTTIPMNPYLFEAGYGFNKFGTRFGFGLDKLPSTHQPSSANGNVKTLLHRPRTDWRIGSYNSVPLHTTYADDDHNRELCSYVRCV